MTQKAGTIIHVGTKVAVFAGETIGSVVWRAS